MTRVRKYRAEDLNDLYHIALETAARGCDASSLYKDPKLVGHIYAAPYALFSPETVFVVEDVGGVAGYIVGVADTADFQATLEARWWPMLRLSYQNPKPIPRDSWTQDQVMSHLIHEPRRVPQELVVPFPAHLHINLLPRLRGRGFGRFLMDHWLRAIHSLGAKGAHIAVGAANSRAMRFYLECGFRTLRFSTADYPNTLWLGVNLEGETQCEI